MYTLIFFIITSTALAQTDVIRREVDFVISQRQTLEKQLVQIRSNKQKKTAELNHKLDVLHQEKARLMVELESTENETSELSRLVKKQSQSQSILSDRLSWIRTKNADLSYFVPSPTSSRLHDSLTDVLVQQAEWIRELSQVYIAQKSFTDFENSLKEGQVFHIGPFARFLKTQDQWTVLSLSDNGYYQQTKEKSFTTGTNLESPFSAAAFVQLPFSKVQPILKEKNLFNSVMDILPAIFLSLVFFSIGWIFIQLAKS